MDGKQLIITKRRKESSEREAPAGRARRRKSGLKKMSPKNVNPDIVDVFQGREGLPEGKIYDRPRGGQTCRKRTEREKINLRFVEVQGG